MPDKRYEVREIAMDFRKVVTMNRYLKRIMAAILCVGLLFSGIEISNYSVNAAEIPDTSVIDVTDLFTGDISSHDCSLYLQSNGDETYHWNECMICKKIFNKEAHQYTYYWTMGNSCSNENKYIGTCSCGYQYVAQNNTRTHHKYLWAPQYSHSYHCFDCNESVTMPEKHYNSSGTLGCFNPGKCSWCGTYVSDHFAIGNYSFVTKTYTPPRCCHCDNIYGSGTASFSGNANGFTAVVTISAPFKIQSTLCNYDAYIHASCSKSVGSYAVTFYINGYYTSKVEKQQSLFCYAYGSGNEGIFFSVTIPPDNTAPVITNISKEDLAFKDGWCTQTELSLNGTEDYCGTVTLSIADEDGNECLKETSVSVNNKKWEYSFKPILEAEEKGKKFIITVADKYNNVSQEEIFYYKVDTRPPTVISENETSKEWSRTKDYTVQATDYGARNVSIAFNDENDYIIAEQNGNNFSVPYTFTGDVYGSTVAAIYAKDGLGNTKTEYVTIHNLDNTAPTITKAESVRSSIRSATVTVEANDINTKLNASGSGVVGYAITQDKTQPGEDAFQPSNTFELTKSGTWYVWAIDAVGNISNPVPVDVKIEYTVSLNPNGGTLTGDSEYKIISGETITIPEPVREGYTFTGWTVNGEDSTVDGNEFTMGSEDADITANWQINQYEVSYIDKDSETGYQLGIRTEMIDYNTPVDGADIGSSSADNAYYPNYRLVETTDSRVTTAGATVYRYFEWLTRDVEGSISWVDNHNKYETRPENIKIVLFQNGKPVNSVDGPLGGEKVDTSPIILSTDGDINSFGFYDLPVYDGNGNPYSYEIRMFDTDADIDFSTPSGITSMENPESKYVTTQNGFDIVNKLQNTAQDAANPDIPDDSYGFEVQGAIHWIDSGNKLGLRPHTVKISLLQDGEPFIRNGEPYEIIVDALGDNTYDFVRLPKYKYVDDEPVPYDYTAVEIITSTYVKDGVILPLYEIHVDENNGVYEALHFTNYLNTDGPMIPIIPTDERDNEISIKTNTKDFVDISLKMLDFYITGTPDNLDVQYGPDYNGNEYKVSVSEFGEVIKHIPSGKYEIDVNESKYNLKDIYVSDNTDNVKIVYENGKYYLVIDHVPGDSKGTINFTMEERPTGFQTKSSARNYFCISYIAALNLIEQYSISELSEPVQAVVTEEDVAEKKMDISEELEPGETIKAENKNSEESYEILEKNAAEQEEQTEIDIEQ